MRSFEVMLSLATSAMTSILRLKHFKSHEMKLLLRSQQMTQLARIVSAKPNRAITRSKLNKSSRARKNSKLEQKNIMKLMMLFQKRAVIWHLLALSVKLQMVNQLVENFQPGKATIIKKMHQKCLSQLIRQNKLKSQKIT